MTVDEALTELEAMEDRPVALELVLDRLHLMKLAADDDAGGHGYVKIEIGKCHVSDWVAKAITDASSSET